MNRPRWGSSNGCPSTESRPHCFMALSLKRFRKLTSRSRDTIECSLQRYLGFNVAISSIGTSGLAKPKVTSLAGPLVKMRHEFILVSDDRRRRDSFSLLELIQSTLSSAEGDESHGKNRSEIHQAFACAS